MGGVVTAFFLLLVISVNGQVDEAFLEPPVVVVNEGEDASFRCFPFIAVAGSIFNTIDPITGVREVLVLTDPRIAYMDIPVGNPDSRVFTWLNVSLADHGRGFFCHFIGLQSNISYVFVKQNVSIEIVETNFTLMRGDPLNVEITIGGYPIPDLVWTLNGEVIESDSRRILDINGILIDSVEPMDAGEYVLTASNDANTESVNISVTVRFAPIFGLEDRISIRAGDDLTIDCDVSGFPAIESLTLIKEGGEGPLQLDLEDVYIVNNAMDDDAGVYVCSATNVIDTTSVAVLVEVGNVPGTVGGIKIDDSVEDIITIQWDAAESNGAEILRYEVLIEYDGITPIKRNATETIVVITREELNIPKEGAEIELVVSVTAVNGIGSGQTTTRNKTAKFDAITISSSQSRVAEVLFSVLLMAVCTVMI